MSATPRTRPRTEIVRIVRDNKEMTPEMLLKKAIVEKAAEDYLKAKEAKADGCGIIWGHSPDRWMHSIEMFFQDQFDDDQADEIICFLKKQNLKSWKAMRKSHEVIRGRKV